MKFDLLHISVEKKHGFKSITFLQFNNYVVFKVVLVGRIKQATLFNRKFNNIKRIAASNIKNNGSVKQLVKRIIAGEQ
jgi:hypothetical protein